MPATGFTPEGMPGFDMINPDSPWLPGRRPTWSRRRQLMSRSRARRRRSRCYSTTRRATARSLSRSRPGGRSSASTSTIKQQEWAQFLEFLGPPPNRRRRVPARLDRRLRRRDQLPRALDVRLGEQHHELLQRGVRRADRGGAHRRQTTTPATSCTPRPRRSSSARTARCRSSPIYWYTYTDLERETVKETYNLNLLDQIDLTKVVVTEVEADTRRCTRAGRDERPVRVPCLRAGR